MSPARLPARCPATVAPLPSRGSTRTLTFSMPRTLTFSMPIDTRRRERRLLSDEEWEYVARAGTQTARVGAVQV